jgi:hypothetical protein
MIFPLIYCVGNKVFIYLVVDLPQASTSTLPFDVEGVCLSAVILFALRSCLLYHTFESYGLIESLKWYFWWCLREPICNLFLSENILELNLP